MKFATKQRTQLLDFLITHEMLNHTFLASIKSHTKSPSLLHKDNLLFIQLSENYYNAILKYHSLLHDTFSDTYAPVARMIFHELDKNNKIETMEDFSAILEKTTEEELQSIFAKKLLKLDYIPSQEEFFNQVKTLETSRASKFVLLNAYSDITKYKENFLNILKNVYPIFLEHYKKAEELFEKQLAEMYNTPLAELNASVLNFFGSEKLSNLYRDYHDNIIPSLDDNIELFPLIMAQNRTVGNPKTEKPFLAIGWQTFNSSKSMSIADNTRKELLKALADDTRFEILRMISFGFNTNKKLSKLFKISPPAITYQTNILKKANLIEIDDSGIIFVKKEVIIEGFDQITSFFDVTGEA